MSGVAKLAGMDNQDELATILARLLESRGWTKEELARQAGLAAKTVSRILNGHTKFPEGATVDALARALGVESGVLDSRRSDFQPQSPTQATLTRIEGKLDELLSRLPEQEDALDVAGAEALQAAEEGPQGTPQEEPESVAAKSARGR